MGENNSKVNFSININSHNNSNNNNSFNDTDNSVDQGIHVDISKKKKKHKILKGLILGILITVIGTVFAHIIITGEMPKTFEYLRCLIGIAEPPAATPPPTTPPTAPPTTPPTTPPTAPPTKKPSIPTLSQTYTGSSAHLALLSDENKRVFPRLGPGTSYVRNVYGYKPTTVYGITAFFEENEFIFCDVRSGAEERYVFFHRNFFDDKGNVPQITSLPYYTGKTTSAVDPRWGPSNGFNVVKDYTASSSTSLRIFFQENGFVYAEYSCSKGLVRMWLPADKVNCPDTVITK